MEAQAAGAAMEAMPFLFGWPELPQISMAGLLQILLAETEVRGGMRCFFGPPAQTERTLPDLERKREEMEEAAQMQIQVVMEGQA